MKKIHGLFPFLLTFLIGLFGLTPAASAAFVSGSTGADGAFEPTASQEYTLPESGVLNFTTVNIPTGVTITFKKNTQNTPVTILATGDVTIAGTVSVNGGNGSSIIPGIAGPGGFNGGQGGAAYDIGKRGEGPGGGAGGMPKTNADNAGGGGGGGLKVTGGAGWGCFATPGSGGPSYGNDRIIPLIGGSGGGGGGGNSVSIGGAGGGGGGSILIASSGTINVSGSITANGGSGASINISSQYNSGGSGGSGSGGSIRLIANTISGNGTISATGGPRTGGYCREGGDGAAGRIRLEASSILRQNDTNPSMSAGYPYAVTPPDMPTLTITSIGGLDVPAVPKGSFGAPDIMLPFNTANPINVVVTGVNIPVGQTVTLKAAPAVGSVTSATGTLAGSTASSTASIQLTISTAYPSVITASVTFEVAALGGGPIYAGGERVDKVRVSSNLGGGSSVTYITASGKEIVAKM